MPSAYAKLGASVQTSTNSFEFTQERANFLHNLAFQLAGESVTLAISWREGEEIANVAFQLHDANGNSQMVRIHGEYFKLRDRISHHLGGVVLKRGPKFSAHADRETSATAGG